jgi:hypothetical protein
VTILLETECFWKEDVAGVAEDDTVPAEESLELELLLLRLSAPATLIISGNCSCNKKWLILSLFSFMVLYYWEHNKAQQVGNTVNGELKYSKVWQILLSPIVMFVYYYDSFITALLLIA